MDPVWFEAVRRRILRIEVVTGSNCRGSREGMKAGGLDLLHAVVRPLEALEDVVESAAAELRCSCLIASDNRVEIRPAPRGWERGMEEEIFEAPTRSVLPLETFEGGVAVDAAALLPFGGS